MGKLTTVRGRNLVREGKPARQGDGDQLYLHVIGSGAAKWEFRFKRGGRARELGLGPERQVSLAEARDAAAEARKLLRSGLDPIDQRKTQSAPTVTFRQAAEAYIASHRAGWRNPKHSAQWTSTLEAYVFPKIGSLAVSMVDTNAVMACLTPIWSQKPETASRVRGRIEAILSAAKSRGWRSGENPAAWRDHLANLLPARSKVRKVEHHAALPWKQVPAFMRDLRARSGVAARALEFAILCAARSGEVRGATWTEMHDEVWIVPASRMKAGREHRVPLSAAALAALEIVRPLARGPDSLVFPSPSRPSTALSDMTLTAVLRRMGRGDLTAHGFRSSFRDWAAETGQPGDLAEAALAHMVKDKTEAAYRRGDLFERRRTIMESWAAFIGGVRPG
jgi:integrase